MQKSEIQNSNKFFVFAKKYNLDPSVFSRIEYWWKLTYFFVLCFVLRFVVFCVYCERATFLQTIFVLSTTVILKPLFFLSQGTSSSFLSSLKNIVKYIVSEYFYVVILW